MSEGDLHTGYKICVDLKVDEKCFRLHKYDKGDLNELFHEHVPKHRISADKTCKRDILSAASQHKCAFTQR